MILRSNLHFMPYFIRPLVAALLASGVLAVTSCGSSPSPSRPSSSQTNNSAVNKPEVTIRNNTYKPIVIGLKGPETRFVSIPARSSRTVNLRSGSYQYAAAAKNTKTISGYKYFSANRNYTWNFSAD